MLAWALPLALALQTKAPTIGTGATVVATPPCGHWEPSFMHDLTGFAVIPRFNAAHIALIPKGPNRGKVLTWDVKADDTTPEWKQRWSIVDVAAAGGPTFENHELTMPANGGDLFCAGFAWTGDGNLLVVGGTTHYAGAGLVAQTNGPRAGASRGSAGSLPKCSEGKTGCCKPGANPQTIQLNGDGCGTGCACGCGSDGDGYIGGKLAYLWDPDTSIWHRQPDMAIDRWYPTVVIQGDGSLISAGGIAGGGETFWATNNYEVFVPTPASNPPSGTWQTWIGGQLWDGPSGIASLLYIYPRLNLLSTGGVYLSGMSGYSRMLDHALAPGVWSFLPESFFGVRAYGTTVLMPYVPDGSGNYQDEVMILGGIGLELHDAGGKSRQVGGSKTASGTVVGPYKSYGVQSTVEVSHPTSIDPAWYQAPSMLHKRRFANGVLLPDGNLFMVGGVSSGGETQPVYVSELYDGTSWTELPAVDTKRAYHSTAALLPDGRVLSAGGNSALRDYQLYVPSYLCSGDPRPVITAAPATMGYYAENPVNHSIAFEAMPAGYSVERAVLVLPAAVTHHTDYNQRYVQLIVESSGADHIEVRAPATRNLVPPGYYMLFLVSNAGVPSQAAWVKVQ